MKKIFCIIILGILGLAVFGSSTVLNVPGTYSTISAACVAAVSGDTILVASGTYNADAILIDSKSLAIIGQGTRPIVTLVKNWDASASAGVGSAAVGIRSSGTPNPMDVYLENLTFIPSTTDMSATRARWGIEVNSGATAATDFTINVNLTDILVCPNDGSNNPVTTDGLAKVNFDPLVAVPFRDDGIWVYGNTNINLTRVIVSNNRPTGSAGAYTSADGLAFYPDFSNFTCQINEGCVFSFNDRIGFQLVTDGCIYDINGTKANPVKFIGNGWYNFGNGDISIFCGGELANPGRVSFNNVLIDSNKANGITSYYGATTGIPISITNTIILTSETVANKYGYLLSQQIGQQMNMENVTILVRNANDTAFFIASDAGAPTVNMSNVILASSSGPNGTGLVNRDTTASVTADYSAFVNTGTYALSAITSENVTLNAGVIYADPDFVSLDPASSDLLDVRTFAFSTAGPSGVPLCGGADYVGALPLGVSPTGPLNVTIGGTKDFSASGGTNNFIWSLSNDAVGYLSSTTGATVTFTATSTGTADLTVSDPGPPAQQITVNISVVPTSTPLYKEIESRKYIRFELFN
ncbi:MAG: hypothetical protein ACE14V_10875 [bacterium]